MSKDLGSLPPLTPELLRNRLAQKPAVLLVPGWDDSTHEQYNRIGAALEEQGWLMRRVDFPGHPSRGAERQIMSRDQNLKELVAAYDSLVDQQAVDETAVAFIGFSYGGYLGALLSARRPLRWMALRSPALYRDEDWFVPKQELDKDELDHYRRSVRRPEENAALAACEAFSGDVLLIESEDDETVPHPTVKSYKASFSNARSFEYRLLEGADHELSSKAAQSRFIDELLRWMNQVTGGGAAAQR
jgi:pimeloyl-ACP methyl ester carboxylesterase